MSARSILVEGTNNPDELRAEVALLRTRLGEAEESLHAIRVGESDAVVVSSPEKGVQVYTLKCADQPYRIFLDQMHEGAVTLSEEGTILYANQHFTDILHATREEVVGCMIHKFVGADEEETLVQLLRDVHRGPTKAECALRCDGHLVQVLLSASPLRLEDLQGVCLVVTDLSAQRPSDNEAALARGWKNRYEAVLRASGHLLYDWHLQSGEVIYGGDVQQILGYAAPEMTGGPTHWLALVHPDNVASYEQELARALKSRGTFACEYRVRHQDGHYRHVQDTGYFVSDAEGNAFRMTGLIVDITGRKRAEEELLRAKAELEQRVRERTAELESVNKELESFSYTVSHDLRTPLRSILSYTQVLQADYAGKLDAQGRELLQSVCQAGERMSQLIEDLLHLARVTQGELRLEQVNLGEMALAVFRELQSTAPERPVEFIVPPKLELKGDPRLLQIVLENLLGNAWKFTSQGSRAKIELGVTARQGETVYYVRDDGAGFDPAYAKKLFGVFQRLHTTSEFPGTGIGLAIVRRVIQRHGGRIWAEGGVGKGATFYFTLPG